MGAAKMETSDGGGSPIAIAFWGRWAGLLLILLALILYIATLDDGFLPRELEGGDLITHQYAQVQARPSNAPGYPLYTMGGWVWFHAWRGLTRLLSNPLPNPIPILSSYSTLWALIALGLIYQLLRRITRSTIWPNGNWPVGWLVTAFYAVTYFFWYYATTTEQYSSAVAQTLAILYLYLIWRERATGPDAQGATGLLLLLAFLCGLSLAHMLTVAFIVPPLVVVVLWQAPWLLRRVRTLIAVVIAAAIPLLSYAYVWVRGAAHPEWWGSGDWANAQEWFWAFLGTAQGREELGWGFEPGAAFFGGGFPELIWQELSIPLIVVGLLGILLLDRKLMALLYGTLAIYLIFDWAYRYGNWFQVILPAYPLLLIGVAAAADRWQLRMNWSQNRGRGFAAWLAWLPHLLLILAIVWRFDASLPAADSRGRDEDTALPNAALLLDQPLPQDANLFAALDDALALQYLTQIWRIRPDLRVVSSRTAKEAVARHEPILATWETVDTLLSEFGDEVPVALQGAGPDWVVVNHADTLDRLALPANARAVDNSMVPGVTLVGYRIQPGPAGGVVSNQRAPSVEITFFWRIDEERWPEGVVISVRPTLGGTMIPVPGQGDEILQQDVHGPLRGQVRTGRLPPGRVVADSYRFELPEPLPAGVDGAALILYRQDENGFENLSELFLPFSEQME